MLREVTMASEPSPTSSPTPEARDPAQAAQSDQKVSPTARPAVLPLGVPNMTWPSGTYAWLRVGRWLQANTLVPPWLPARWRHPATGYLLVVALQMLAAVITRLLIGFFS